MLLFEVKKRNHQRESCNPVVSVVLECGLRDEARTSLRRMCMTMCLRWGEYSVAVRKPNLNGNGEFRRYVCVNLGVATGRRRQLHHLVQRSNIILFRSVDRTKMIIWEMDRMDWGLHACVKIVAWSCVKSLTCAFGRKKCEKSAFYVSSCIVSFLMFGSRKNTLSIKSSKNQAFDFYKPSCKHQPPKFTAQSAEFLEKKRIWIQKVTGDHILRFQKKEKYTENQFILVNQFEQGVFVLASRN